MLIIVCIIALITGALGFFGGMMYSQKRNPSISGQQGGRNGRFQQGRAGISGSGIIRGEILSRDDTRITVKLHDGSGKIVFVSETTAITKAGEGSKADLVPGKQVMVIGKDNADGSVTAQNIQIDPQYGRPTPGAPRP